MDEQLVDEGLTEEQLAQIEAAVAEVYDPKAPATPLWAAFHRAAAAAMAALNKSKRLVRLVGERRHVDPSMFVVKIDPATALTIIRDMRGIVAEVRRLRGAKPAPLPATLAEYAEELRARQTPEERALTDAIVEDLSRRPSDEEIADAEKRFLADFGLPAPVGIMTAADVEARKEEKLRQLAGPADDTGGDRG